MSKAQKSDTPFVLVIFGATGDLTRRKLVPALFELYHAGLLPKRFIILGYARRDWSKADFALAVSKHLPVEAGDFLEHLEYQQGDFAKSGDYYRLSQRLTQLDAKLGKPSQRLFYIATPADSYQAILGGLADAKLPVPSVTGGWTRIVVEKPFGHDLASAQAIDGLLRTIFSEDQIYRIDHYLAKETAQNILAFRFANGIFESIWDKNHVQQIEIIMKETIGVEGRGAFYDKTGVIRDVIQNHLLQLLALVTMEEPANRTAESFRDSRAGMLNTLINSIEHQNSSVQLGQYQGYQVEGYVDPNSRTPTFARIEFELLGTRWKGIPVILTAGKALDERATTIKVTFNAAESNLYSLDERSNYDNAIEFNIQPNEGIEIGLLAKSPGYGHRLEPVSMHFDYTENFKQHGIEAYNRLLLDVIEGDQSLFTRSDEIEAQWNIIDPVISKIEADNLIPRLYARGSAGPIG